MSNTHEALRIAEHPGTSDAAAEKIRSMHALIVQMAEALGEALIAANTGKVLAGGYKDFVVAAKNQATQYLEQK